MNVYSFYLALAKQQQQQQQTTNEQMNRKHSEPAMLGLLRVNSCQQQQQDISSG